MRQYVCIVFENIFDYTKPFESDDDMKNIFCSNFHFKLKRNLHDESDEEIDNIGDLFYSYKNRKSDEEEGTVSTIVAVTANITSVISRTEKRVPVNQILFETKSGGIDAIADLLVRCLKSKSEFSAKGLI